MSAYDCWLAAPYTEAVEPTEPTDEQLDAAVDHVAERGGDILLYDMRDEGFYLDNLRAVIVARTPAAQARACEAVRHMFQLLHAERIETAAQRIAAAEIQRSKDDAAEYAAQCMEDC